MAWKLFKAKKLEYDTKMETAEKETEEVKKDFEAKIADLKQEVQRLKSSSSENDEQTVFIVILFCFRNSEQQKTNSPVFHSRTQQKRKTEIAAVG